MTTMETLQGLGKVMEGRTTLSQDSLVEPVGDLQQRVATLEKIHYRWAPVILVALVGGYFLLRKSQ